MRIRAILLVAALGAASLGAQGQQAAVTSSSKGPSGLSFAFDAPSGQLTASGLALNPTPKASSAVNITGTIDVTVIVNLVSRFSPDTDFPCSAIAIGGQLNTDTATVNGGIETANGRAVHGSTPGTVTCSLSIPYEWTLSTGGGDTGLIIAFAVAAVNERGKVQRSTIQVSGVESLPANGSTSKFTFHAAL